MTTFAGRAFVVKRVFLRFIKRFRTFYDANQLGANSAFGLIFYGAILFDRRERHELSVLAINVYTVAGASIMIAGILYAIVIVVRWKKYGRKAEITPSQNEKLP